MNNLTNICIVWHSGVIVFSKPILFGFGNLTEYAYNYYSYFYTDRILIQIYSVLKNHPNTNKNIIWFENICRIRISLFGLNYSNSNQIPNCGPGLSDKKPVIDEMPKSPIEKRKRNLIFFSPISRRERET